MKGRFAEGVDPGSLTPAERAHMGDLKGTVLFEPGDPDMFAAMDAARAAVRQLRGEQSPMVVADPVIEAYGRAALVGWARSRGLTIFDQDGREL